MNIAVDIDDTLTDSFAYLQPFVAAYFGADADELRRQGISYSNLPPACGRWVTVLSLLPAAPPIFTPTHTEPPHSS